MSLLSAITKKFHRRKESRSNSERNESRSESRNESPNPSHSRGRSRSPRANAAKNDEEVREKSGLFLLNHVDAESEFIPMVDIVAVHGLGGDWEQTWSEKNGNLWLRDFLPSHLPHQARVFSYGYDSSTAFSRTVADIEVQAAMLLDRLENKRDTPAERSRPVVFVAHSLGGILVKKAMILANERSDHYGKLLDSIKASIFLAVPHRGADIAFWAAFAARLLRNAQLGFGGNPAFVEALQRNSGICADISRQFVGRSAKLSIRTFFETEQMGNQIIVDRDSACLNLPNELAVGIAGANHRSICKFANIDSQKYEPVRSALNKLVADIVPATPPTASETPKLESFVMTKEQLECFQMLYRSTYESHKLLVPKRVTGTLEWFFQHPNYINWRDSPSDAAIWITADPGCGKTVLARSVIDELSTRLSHHASEQALICYFFFKDDNETQGSAAFALCSVLHQLVSSENQLITAVMSEYRAKKDKFLSDPFALWKVFIDAVSISNCRNIVCVLDALDECSIGSRDVLMGRVVDAFKDHAESMKPKRHASLKLLMTSRPLAPLERAFVKISRIRFKAENEIEAVERDIERVISARLDEIASSKHLSPEVRSELQRSLTGDADRTFLWVSLVLQQVEDSMSASYSSIKTVLSSAPRSLDELYEKILSQSEDQVILRRLLHIIVGAKANLSLAEVNIALHIDNNTTNYQSLQRDCQPSSSIESYVRRLCGSFVRIFSSHVYLVHQTAKEFLVPKLRGEGTFQSVWKHSLAPTESNMILAQSCIWYISLSEFDVNWVRLSDKGTWKASPRLSRFLKDHHFLDYSSRYWTTHFQSASTSTTDSLTQGARGLCRTASPRFRTWYKVYWSSFNRGSPKTYTDLGEAAAFGLVPVMEIMLKEGLDIDTVDADGDTPLITACMHKQPMAAQFLIEHGAANEIAACDGNVALSTAAAFGLTEIVDLLLRQGVNASPQNNKGKTPLDRAYQFGHMGCVEKLLGYGARANLTWDADQCQ